METSPKRARAFTLIGGAAAAATAAFVASRLGVAGTIVGAAVASIVASIGAEVYIRAASTSAAAVTTLAQRRQIAGLVDDAVGDESSAPVPLDEGVLLTEDDPAEPDEGGVAAQGAIPTSNLADLRFSWKHVAVVALIVFLVVLVTITVLELVIGKPLSSLWGGDNKSGTSLGQAINPKAPAASPSTSPTPTLTPSATSVVTPTATATSNPTPTVTVTVTAPPPTAPISVGPAAPATP